MSFVATDVINRAQQAYYELAFANGELGVRRELLASRQQLLAATRRRIEMGTLTVLDERQAEAEVARVEVTVTAADNAVRLAENQLKFVLGDSWTNSVNERLQPMDALLVLPERFDLQECWQRGLTNRADLAQLRQEVEKTRLDLRYRRNQLFPSLDLVAGYWRKGASTDQVLPPQPPSASLPSAREQIADGTSPSDMLGFVFSVPLTLSQERANYRVSKNMKAQAELRVKQSEEQVMREIADAVHGALVPRAGRQRPARARTLRAGPCRRGGKARRREEHALLRVAIADRPGHQPLRRTPGPGRITTAPSASSASPTPPCWSTNRWSSSSSRTGPA